MRTKKLSNHQPADRLSRTKEDNTPTTPGSEFLRIGSQPTPLDMGEKEIVHPPSYLGIGDHVFEREILATRSRFGIDEEKVRYRRRVVEDIKRTPNGSWQWHFRYRLPAGEDFVKTLVSKSPAVRSYPPSRMPDFPLKSYHPRVDQALPVPYRSPDWQCVRWECCPKEPPAIGGSPKQLNFHQVSGNGSRYLVNRLLSGGPDGQFDHILSGVNKFKFAFIATHNGHPYSVLTLAQPYNSDTGNGDGSEVLYLTRLCNHPHAPKNTSSWMIGKARRYVKNHTAVNRLVAIAGINNNTGTVYDAAGFDLDSVTHRKHDIHGPWKSYRWVCELDS